MDEHTFVGRAQVLAFNSAVITSDHFLLGFGLVVDLIERPTFRFPLTGDFLLHGSEETLRVEETSEPVRLRALLKEPGVQLEMSVDQTLQPRSKTGC